MLLINYIIVTILTFVVLPRLFYKIYPTLRGQCTEKHISKELKKLPDEYKVLNDIMVEVDGKTCQIDHIVISKYGIYVIETKGYYGLITGNQYKDNWTQIVKKKKINYISNPIRQNYFHIKTLEKLLNIEYQKFISIICFLKTAELRISTNDANIVFDSDLINFILNNKEIILEVNVENIYEKIIKLNINDKKKRRQHNSIINEKKEQKNELIKNNICPKCGGNIIDKKGRYGYFKGCSNYPKCKFIVRKQK